jgi:hypothetical protein
MPRYDTDVVSEVMSDVLTTGENCTLSGNSWHIVLVFSRQYPVMVVGPRLASDISSTRSLNQEQATMPTKFLPAFVLLATTTIAPALFAAERIAVVPVSGINVHPAYQQMAQDLFKDYLAESGKYALVDVPAAKGTAPYDATQAVEAGRAAGADLVMLVRLTHLQNSFRVRIMVYQVETKAMVHTDSLGSTGGPDELDPVVSRLVKAYAKGERAGDNAEIDSVTQKESDPYLKKTATKSFGLRLGTVIPFNRPQGSTTAGPGLGIFWLYDAREYMAEVFLDFVTKGTSTPADEVSAFNVGLGLYRPFSRKDVVPYAGGGIAYSISNFGGAGANGLRLHGAFGVLFGRLSSVQIRGEVAYFMNTYQESTYYSNYLSTTENNPKHLSHGPMLTVGIGF